MAVAAKIGTPTSGALKTVRMFLLAPLPQRYGTARPELPRCLPRVPAQQHAVGMALFADAEWPAPREPHEQTVMTSRYSRLVKAFGPVQRRLARVDLRDHEDKILLLLALVVSAVVGLIVVAFLAVTERMGKVLVNAGPMQRLLSPLLGSLVGGWMLYKYFPDARGSGVPQTRVALVLQKGVIGMRTVFGKFISSSISLGSGVALGREGPSVQIGGGIASAAGRRLGLSDQQVQSLIPVGTAAAIAAAFNTPLAAVLFTLEEILADLHAG